MTCLQYWSAAFSALALLFPVAARAQQDRAVFVPVPGSNPVIVDSVTPGQVFLSYPAQHARVGVLANDIRGTGLVNSDRIVVPSGTHVYYAVFGSNLSTSSFRYRGWCGVVQAERKSLGYCMLAEKDGYVLGKLPSNGSFFAPRRLADYGLRPVTTPEVTEGPEARQSFPPISMSLTVQQVLGKVLVVRTTAMIDGERINLGDTLIDRAANGAATVQLGDTAVRITPSPDGNTARIARVQ